MRAAGSCAPPGIEALAGVCSAWPPVLTVGLVRGLDLEGCCDLRVYLADLPDSRGRSGRWYGYRALVTVAAAAMLGGANSVTAIFRWGRDAPAEVLLPLGVTGHREPGASASPKIPGSLPRPPGMDETGGGAAR